MEFLNKWIETIGRKNVIYIGCGMLLAIILIFIYRFIRIKKYRKQLIELENKMNAVKTMPIQYRLGRVQGIAKNIPEAQEQYEKFEKEFGRLSTLQSNDIVALINEVDEKLFYRKLRGTRSKIKELTKLLDQYETDSQMLLENIEVITEIENEQRIKIIKIKELYRQVNDAYATVRFKIEDFVPAVTTAFKTIDQHFVELEDYMNDQKFEEASNLTKSIKSEINFLGDTIRDLPTYISIVRNYLPKNLKEIDAAILNMKERGFALENLNTTMRVEKIKQDLENTMKLIMALDLEQVGSSIEEMTDEVHRLKSDFEKEEAAFHEYNEKRDRCYQSIKELDEKFKHYIEVMNELKANYLLDETQITIAEDYEGFTNVLDELSNITDVIESKDFSYTNMMERFDHVLEMSKPYETAIIKHEQLTDHLKIQEKRALDELDNINIVLLEIKSEIKNKHLPMINESYKDYIEDSYQKADEILAMTKRRPIDLQSLSKQVDAARDVIYKLYDNVHNLIVTAEMVEDAIVYGNRYRSTFLEVNTELTKAELLFRNGEYTKALATSVDIIEKIKPGSYEMLVQANNTKSN